MADADVLPTPRTLTSVDKIMFEAATWMFHLMADLEDRPPADVVMLPHFRSFLAATTHTPTFMTKVSLDVITEEIRIKKASVATNVVKKGSKVRAKKDRKQCEASRK